MIKRGLLTQQTPRTQEPLGAPLNNEQTAPGTQIPELPVGDVQLLKTDNGLAKFGFKLMGKRLPKPENGFIVVNCELNRLPKNPAFRSEAPSANRLSAGSLDSLRLLST